MDETMDQTVARILAWPARWRALMAEVPLDSLDREPPFEVSEAWQQEIRRRAQELDDGAATGIPAGEVIAELRALAR